MIFLKLFALLLSISVLEAKQKCPKHFHLSPGNFCIGAVKAFSDHSFKLKQCPYGFNIFSYDPTNKSLTDILLHITEDGKVYHVRSELGKADLIIRFNGRITARSVDPKTFKATCKKLGKSSCVDENVMSTVCNSSLCASSIEKTHCSAKGKLTIRTWISLDSLSSDEYCYFQRKTYMSKGKGFSCYPNIYVNKIKRGCKHVYDEVQNCTTENLVTDSTFTVKSKRTITAKREVQTMTTPFSVSPTSNKTTTTEVDEPMGKDTLTDAFELNTTVSTNEESPTPTSVPLNQTNSDENKSIYTNDIFANATEEPNNESNTLPADFSHNSTDTTVTVMGQDNFTGTFEITTLAHVGNETNSSNETSPCNTNSKSKYHQYPSNIETSHAAYIAGIIILSLCIVLVTAGFIYFYIFVYRQYKKYTVQNTGDVSMANVSRETEIDNI